METLPLRFPHDSRALPVATSLKAGLATGAALSTGPLIAPGRLRAQPKRGGILRVRGYDPSTSIRI